MQKRSIGAIVIKNKFKFGDKVKMKDGECFVVSFISYENGFFSYAPSSMQYFVSESLLELVVEPLIAEFEYQVYRGSLRVGVIVSDNLIPFIDKKVHVKITEIL